MYRGTALPLVVIIALIVIGSLGYFYFKPRLNNQKAAPAASPAIAFDSYSGWKTYTNKTYGFSLRYPPQWNIKTYADYSADFYTVDPQSKEATPGTAVVRFLRSSEKADIAEFTKIQKLEEGSQFAEPLDVRSQVTKIKNFEISGLPAIDYVIDRAFSALEGPRGEFSHVISVNKDGIILKFVSRSDNKEQQTRIYDPSFSQIIFSIKF